MGKAKKRPLARTARKTASKATTLEPAPVRSSGKRKAGAKKAGAAKAPPATEPVAAAASVSEPSKPKILVISGPNLSRLGKREPEIYGDETLAEIHERLHGVAEEIGVTLSCRQSNHEGQIVDWIGEADYEGFDGIVINGAAYTHSSIAIYDALRTAALPAVEVHLSNPHAREAFRHNSYLVAACIGQVSGFGGDSYVLGLWGLAIRIQNDARSIEREPERKRRK